MKITHEQVEKYQALCLKDYGQPIEFEVAQTELTALVTLLSIVHRYMERVNWPDVMG